MSVSRTADVVPFVHHSMFETEPSEDNELTRLIAPEAVIDFIEDDEEAENFEPLGMVVRGWTLDEIAVGVGNRSRLYGDRWINGNYVVYLVNESEHGHVGYYDVAIVADNELSIAAFYKDFVDLTSSKLQINPIDSCSQTL